MLVGDVHAVAMPAGTAERSGKLLPVRVTVLLWIRGGNGGPTSRSLPPLRFQNIP
jgi:hypothetical protein